MEVDVVTTFAIRQSYAVSGRENDQVVVDGAREVHCGTNKSAPLTDLSRIVVAIVFVISSLWPIYDLNANCGLKGREQGKYRLEFLRFQFGSYYPGPRGFLDNPPRGEIRAATLENLWDQGRFLHSLP